jgi:hypothetical protein
MMLLPSKDKFKFLILIIVIINNVRIVPVRFLTARAPPTGSAKRQRMSREAMLRLAMRFSPRTTDSSLLLHEAPLASSGSARMLTRGLFGSGVRSAGTARTARLAFSRRDHQAEAVVADASTRKGTLARKRVPLSSEHTSSEPPSWRKRSLIPRKPTPSDPIQS